MSRRSFCFLFGAGIAGAMLGAHAYQHTNLTLLGETAARELGERILNDHAAPRVIAKKIFTSFGDGPYRHIATVPPEVSSITYGKPLRFRDADGKPVAPTWVAPQYRR